MAQRLTKEVDAATHKIQKLRDEIVEIFLNLTPRERVNLFDDIKWNDIFCVNCGYGSKANPNGDCQCENDD